MALGEIGRIERTLFMLNRIENTDLRMECQAGLNKGEVRHSLARAIFAHSHAPSGEWSRRRCASGLGLADGAVKDLGPVVQALVRPVVRTGGAGS